MDSKTKLVFALEHIHHLHDLFEDNQFEKYLQDAVYTLEYECERQLKLELEKKHPTLSNEEQISIPKDFSKDLDWIEKSGWFEWTPGSPWPPEVPDIEVDCGDTYTQAFDHLMGGLQDEKDS